jgi:hypothetical protein
MEFRHYHTPAKPVSTRVHCPVCHEAVYSRGNIHPQCAVKQSESPRPKNLAAVVTDPGVEVGQAADQPPPVLSDPPNPETTFAPHTPVSLITAIAVPPSHA